MFETMVKAINGGGEWFCGWAWAMLWQSSVLIALLFIADMLLRKRVRATVRYALWMLVLVKLVLPPSLCVPTGVGYWCNVESAFQTKQVVEEKTDKWCDESHPTSESTAAAPLVTKATTTPSMPVGEKLGQTPEEKGSDTISLAVRWQAVVLLAWLVGIVVLVLLLLQRMTFVRSLVGQSKPAEGRLREIMEACRVQAGVRGNVELRLTESMLSPAACGLVRPVVLMPRPLLEGLSRERVRAVLMHELMHIRRMDLWVNVAQTIVQIAHFYNPLLWLANARIRAIREQAVDEASLASLGDEAKEYGRTLVAVAEIAFGRPHFSLGLVGVVESKKSLAARIRHIAQMGIPKSAKIGLAGMVAVIVAGCMLLPMANAEPSPATFVVKGKVTDAATGKPIAGARVGDERYAGGKQWTTSDANGNYSYLTWYEEHGVSAEADGYKKQNKGFVTKIFGSEKEKVLNFELATSAVDRKVKEAGLTKEGFVGHWRGQAKMVVDFVADSNLPVDITIDANGVVTGKVGDAKIINAKMTKKGFVELEWLKQKRRYIIQGGLEGDIIAKEGIRRDKFAMGLDIEGNRIVGSVGTSGVLFGSKKFMMIVAHDMVLEAVKGN